MERGEQAAGLGAESEPGGKEEEGEVNCGRRIAEFKKTQLARGNVTGI
jgi:hypothetical protein